MELGGVHRFGAVFAKAKTRFEKWTRRNRANYNIHALKLRQLKGYSVTSRDFAKELRDNFENIRGRWPNVSVDYGPLTLMQGWIAAIPIVSKRTYRSCFSVSNT